MKKTHFQDIFESTSKIALKQTLVRKNRMIATLLAENRELREQLKESLVRHHEHKAIHKQFQTHLNRFHHLEKFIGLQHKLLSSK